MALQNLAFVGSTGEPEEWERPPQTRYSGPWFPNPDFFPDPFSETVARDLTGTAFADFSPEERAALRQAADHPAQEEFELLARAARVDVVSGRWSLPFPDTLTFQSLPWPRFAAFRTAGLARVAKAAVEASDGDAEAAEETLRELISTGFLLVDQGPTLIDNLMGVVLVKMGGDGMEGLYRQTGRTADARAMAWAREGAALAARKARAGMASEDIHSLLQGIPEMVLDEAPHKMVFGPDESLSDWRLEARRTLVQVRGEASLFALAQGASAGTPDGELEGFLPRFLSLTLGRSGAPGSCASLIAALESGEGR